MHNGGKKRCKNMSGVNCKICDEFIDSPFEISIWSAVNLTICDVCWCRVCTIIEVLRYKKLIRNSDIRHYSLYVIVKCKDQGVRINGKTI